ncbi:MAG: amino acid ABC transporter permease, partial [Hyphomicrobiales bacterium]|nr:amino acid ABC transporter permease [Hyphomicrobiales bacterium]
LARNSRLPAARALATAYVETMRGVPFVAVLFLANTMLPLFLPDGAAPDRMLRPLFAVVSFASAYLCENVRGGLRAVPRGQDEAARALGLPWRARMRLVVLPQALRAALPSIVGAAIGLFKDTTLVAAVGIFDFLHSVDVAVDDPKWAAASVPATGYAFAALVYFAFCFGMSRYAAGLEARLDAGKAR